MKLLLTYIRKHSKLVALALFLATINQVFSMLDPMILGHIIDKYVKLKDTFTAQEFLTHILTWIGIAWGAAMVSRIAKSFQDYFMNVITQKVGVNIYEDGLKHALDLPFQEFEDQRSGQTLGILQKVRTDSEKLIDAGINVLFPTLVGIVFVIFYAFSINWIIAPVYFMAIPIIAFVSSTLGKKVKQVQKKIVGETTALAGATTESLRNIELVKSLGLVKQEEKRLNNTTRKILVLELKKVRYIRSLSFLQGTTINLIRNSILLFMFLLIFRNELEMGKFLALFIYSFFIFGPLQSIGNIINTYREAEVSLENFKNLLSTPTEVKPSNPVPINDIKTLSFEKVSFLHKTANLKALENISFSVQKGETIAFAGPSGAGKSTLVKLLVGLYKPAMGRILYNDIPADEVDLDAFREKVGFVTQDTQLFAGTIRENLLFVNPNATDEQCYEVLKKAACHNLLARADKGLDTVIGEGGVKVSGGEKQRLSIARALLRNPDLLVFDEATSSLDSITEDEVSQTIRNVSDRVQCITILIAHRLSTIMHADRIYVLERGKIIESGKHYDLLEQKGLYYAMWRQQIGESKRYDSLVNKN